MNDVADAWQLHRGSLASVRGAVPPSRNGLSHANKVRSAELAEKLFWGVLDHLGQLSPEFELVANAMDWTKHAGAKPPAKPICA